MRASDTKRTSNESATRFEMLVHMMAGSDDAEGEAEAAAAAAAAAAVAAAAAALFKAANCRQMRTRQKYRICARSSRQHGNAPHLRVELAELEERNEE